MDLTYEQVKWVKEQYAEKLKAEEVEALQDQMWIEVREAKPDWKRVVAIKREYQERINAL